METKFLAVPGGRLAYDEQGTGPLVICVPGMGDLRGSYRFLAPQLAEAGFRVVTVDVRGHGETSVRWDDYSVAGIGADILALARALGSGPAFVIGTSMASGAAIWAAAEAPEQIAGIVLIGPAVRDADQPGWKTRMQRLVFGALFSKPWGPALWMRYFASLYPTAKPSDFAAYTRRLAANLREPGRLTALRRMVLASKAPSAERLTRVSAPAFVVMGTKDRDFPDPAAEARLVAAPLHAQVLMIEGAGHYPHAEMPERAVPEILRFLSSVRAGVAHGA